LACALFVLAEEHDSIIGGALEPFCDSGDYVDSNCSHSHLALFNSLVEFPVTYLCSKGASWPALLACELFRMMK